MPIIIPRGPKEDVDNIVHLPGHLVIDTTEYILRVGDGETRGGVHISGSSGTDTITTSAKLYTFENVLIEDHIATIPYGKYAKGGIVGNIAFIRGANEPYVDEYNCCVDSADYTKIVFEESDNLNGKFATFTILTESNVTDETIIITVENKLIQDNMITLDVPSAGDIVLNKALICDSVESTVFDDYTCSISDDNTIVEFDEDDNLNGKYATFSYLKTV